jgi:hypothetical protein
VRVCLMKQLGQRSSSTTDINADRILRQAGPIKSCVDEKI